VRSDIGAVLAGVSLHVTSDRRGGGQRSKTDGEDGSTSKQSNEASHGLIFDTRQENTCLGRTEAKGYAFFAYIGGWGSAAVASGQEN